MHKSANPLLVWFSILFLSMPCLVAQSAQRVLDIRPGIEGSNPRQMVDVFGTLLFAAHDGSEGEELWKSDGTATGTVQVKDLMPGVGSSAPADLTVSGAQVFFSAADGFILNRVLWRTDGTSSGTFVVKPTGGPTSPKELVDFQGVLLFQGRGPGGRELWISDGTAAGTRELADLSPSPNLSGEPTELTVCGNQVFFTAKTPGEGWEIWVTDGTTAGTRRVDDIWVGPEPQVLPPRELTCLNGKLYFVANDGQHGFELWTSDGTAAGTLMVKDIVAANGSGQPRHLAVCDGKLFFQATEPGVSGVELWVSDGTAAGTMIVEDISPGSTSSTPRFLTCAGKRLFFSAVGPTKGRELWITDGTKTGTQLVKDISQIGGSSPRDITTVGDKVYFVAADILPSTGTGTELWVSDGSPSGTRLVADIAKGTHLTSSNPGELTVTRGTLMFAATTGSRDRELYIVGLPGASSSSVGTSCAPLSPRLDSTIPRLGQALELSGDGPQDHVGFLLFSLPRPPVTLPGGCLLYVDLAAALNIRLGNVRAFRETVQVPNLPSLNGLSVHAQTLWVNQIGGNPFATSQALSLGVGR